MRIPHIRGGQDHGIDGTAARRLGRVLAGSVLALSLGAGACGGGTSSSGTASSGETVAAQSGASASGAVASSPSTESGSGSGDTVAAGSGSTTVASSGSGAGNVSPAGSGTGGGSTASSGGSTAAPGGSGEASGGAASGTAGSSGGPVAGVDAGSASATVNDASTGGGDASKPDQSTLPPVTIHMAGDSTMSNYTTATTQEGWGQELGQYFISQVTIDNQAQPGANIQTFYSGKWKTLIANVKAGDYVMAAFGINDSGTTHGPVSVPDFTTELGVMASEVAAKSATFIPTTSSPLQVWVNGMETNTRLQPYVDATIAFGMSKNLLVDNLNAAGVAYYNMIGQTAAAALTFNGDKAHFDKAGATEMALLASKQLATIGSPLANYLK